MSPAAAKALFLGGGGAGEKASPGAVKAALGLYLQLTKTKINLAVAITAVMGYVMAGGGWGMALPLSIFGTFLLASGAAALNQWQEAPFDARMRRTRTRPIPSGRIRPAGAFFIGAMLLLAGFYLLSSLPQNMWVVMALGALAVFWYNGVYTPLKRVTPFAVVPGALIGAIPPLIGWCAAGGEWNHPLVLHAAFFMYIWQIPHFWLLLLMYGKQYDDAGLPTLTKVFSRAQLHRITFMWVLATAVTGLSLPAFEGRALLFPWNVAVVLSSVWIAAKGAGLLWRPEAQAEGKPFLRAFMQINLYALVVVACLSLSALGMVWP